MKKLSVDGVQYYLPSMALWDPFDNEHAGSSARAQSMLATLLASFGDYQGNAGTFQVLRAADGSPYVLEARSQPSVAHCFGADDYQPAQGVRPERLALLRELDLPVMLAFGESPEPSKWAWAWMHHLGPAVPLARDPMRSRWGWSVRGWSVGLTQPPDIPGPIPLEQETLI